MPSEKKQRYAKLHFHIMFFVVRFLSRIPLRAGRHMGRTFATFFGLMPLERMTVVKENLRRALGNEFPESELRSIHKGMLRHFGQMVFEVPHILRINQSNLDTYVVFENEKYLLQALEKGKGVFALTAHFGNWELMSTAIALRFGNKIAVVARPMDSAPLERVVTRLRSRFGTEIISKQNAMRRLIKAARENKIIGILLDQNVDWYEGVFVDFFGSLACTNKGLALIALKLGAPVVPIFSVRQADGRYRVIIEKEVSLVKTGDKSKDIEENTFIFTSIIEKYVRRYPDQWLWFHQRWKTKPYCTVPPNTDGRNAFGTTRGGSNESKKPKKNG